MTEVVLQGIRKSFSRGGAAAPGGDVLRGIDLTVAPGECFALLGSSGCGKTTLLRIVAGLERPDAGRVLMDGRDVTALPPEQRPTAMVFQIRPLPHLTVGENVAFGLRLRKKTKREIECKVGEMLDLVHLSGKQDRRIDEISGGQQQRVALARVLAVEPQVLLLDEPLSNLDAMLRRSTRSAIREIQTALGLTTIYITHDQEEALAISDRLALMHEGQIVQAGAPEDLFERPATVEVARFLGQRNIVPAVVRLVAQAGGPHRKGDDGLSSAAPPARTEAQLALDGGEALLTISVGGPGAAVADVAHLSNGPVWLALLPSDVVLSRDSDADGWPAEVAVVSFGGTETHVEVRLNETGETLRAVVGGEAGLAHDAGVAGGPCRLRRGERVRVCVRRGGGLIYERK